MPLNNIDFILYFALMSVLNLYQNQDVIRRKNSSPCWQHRHHIKNRLNDGTNCTPCFVLLELLVAVTKNHFEEQVLVAGTKQSRHTDLADMHASFVLCLLQALTLQSGFYKLTYLEQSTFLRYLWFAGPSEQAEMGGRQQAEVSHLKNVLISLNQWDGKKK